MLMATKQAATFRNTVPNGTYGVLSKTEGKATFTADAAGTEVHTLRLEAGTKLYGLKAHHDNLGAGTSIKVGYAYVDANHGAAVDDAFCSGATTSPGVLEFEAKPITLNHPTILTVTSAGIATGDVVVIPEYEYRGV
jgi:hypothetical protein